MISNTLKSPQILQNSGALHSNRFFGIPALLLSVMLALMVLSSIHKPLSFDEPHNLDYGRGFIQQGTDYYTHGQRMPVLALNALPCLSFNCDGNTLNADGMKRLSVRFPSMLAALLLGLLIWQWTRELFGSQAALLSLALYALNPTLIAHGKQVTSDGYTALFSILAAYYFWKLLKRGGKKYFLLALLTAAASTLAKFTSIILFLVFIPLLLLEKYAFRGSLLSGVKWKRILTLSALFCAGWLILINAGYGFNGTFRSTQKDTWQSSAVQRAASLNLPAPFPAAFMKGMDYSFYIEEHDQYGRGNNYILGKRHRKGRWYAFPLMILLKNPLALFALLGIAFSLFKIRTSGFQNTVYLGVPFIVWLVFFSVGCDVQVGIRYILPALPFLFIFAGKSVYWASSAAKKAALGLLTAWYALSSLSYHPHYMSYFNETIGARVNAYRFLSDSNLEWENISYFLDLFKARYPEVSFHEGNDILKGPKAGTWIVPAMHYTGVIDEHETKWIREFKPVRHIEYSHYWIEVPESQMEMLRHKYGAAGS